MSFIIRLENIPWSANAADIRHFFGRIEIPEGGIHIIGGVRGIAFIALNHEFDVREAFLQDSCMLHKNCIRLFQSDHMELDEYIKRVQNEVVEDSINSHEIDPREHSYFPEKENRRKLHREDLYEQPSQQDIRRSPYYDDRRKSPVRDIRKKSPVRDNRRRSPARRNIRNSPEPFIRRKTPDRIIRQKSPERFGTSSRRRSRSPIMLRNRSKSSDRHHSQNDFPRKVSPHSRVNESFPIKSFESESVAQNMKQNLDPDVKFIPSIEFHEQQLPPETRFGNQSDVPVKVDGYNELSKHIATSTNLGSNFTNVVPDHSVERDFDNSLRDPARFQSIPFISDKGCFPDMQKPDRNRSQMFDEMAKLPQDKRFVENVFNSYNPDIQEHLSRFTQDRFDRSTDLRERFPDYRDKFPIPSERFHNPFEGVSNRFESTRDFPGRFVDFPMQSTGVSNNERNIGFSVQERGMNFRGLENFDEIRYLSRKRVPNYCVMLSGFNKKDNYKEVQQVLKKVYAPQKNIKWGDNRGRETSTALVKICNEEDFYAVLRSSVLYLNGKRIEVTKCPDEIFWEMFPNDCTEYENEPNDLIYMLKGLPYTATEKEIMNFFQDLKLIDIVILYDKDGKATGTGFIEFDHIEDYKNAFERNGKKIGHRYIELIRSCRDDVIDAKKYAVAVNDPFKASDHQHIFFESPVLRQPAAVRPLCALLSGLPPSLRNSQIYDFFAEGDVQPQAVHILITHVQHPVGRAYVEFYDPFEFDVALRQHGKCIEEYTISVKQVLFEEMMNILETHDASHLYTNKQAVIKRRSSPVPEKVPYLWEPPDEAEESKYKVRIGDSTFNSRLQNQNRNAMMSYNNDSRDYPRYVGANPEKRNVQVFDYAHRGNKDLVTDLISEFAVKNSAKEYSNIHGKNDMQNFNENVRYLQNVNSEFGKDRGFSNRNQTFESNTDSFKNHAPLTPGSHKLREISDRRKYQNPSYQDHRSSSNQPGYDNTSSSASSRTSRFQHTKNDEKAYKESEKSRQFISENIAAGGKYGIKEDNTKRNREGLSPAAKLEKEKSVSENIDAGRKYGIKESNTKRNREGLSPTVKLEKEKQTKSDDANNKRKCEKLDKKERESIDKKPTIEKQVDKCNEIHSDKMGKDNQKISSKKKTEFDQKNDGKKNEPIKNKGKPETSYPRSIERKRFRSRSNERSSGKKTATIDPSAMFGSSGCIIQASNVHPQAGLAELLEFFRSYSLSADDIIRRFTDSGFPTGDIRIAFHSPQEAKRALRDLNYRKIRGVPIKMVIL